MDGGGSRPRKQSGRSSRSGNVRGTKIAAAFVSVVGTATRIITACSRMWNEQAIYEFG
jgi:hypothetical protein